MTDKKVLGSVLGVDIPYHNRSTNALNEKKTSRMTHGIIDETMLDTAWILKLCNLFLTIEFQHD